MRTSYFTDWHNVQPEQGRRSACAYADNKSVAIKGVTPVTRVDSSLGTKGEPSSIMMRSIYQTCLILD
jgi:hypothetical protein